MKIGFVFLVSIIPFTTKVLAENRSCVTNETNCWSCGTNCVARLNNEGEFKVERANTDIATGTMNGYLWAYSGWQNQKSKIKSITIEGSAEKQADGTYTNVTGITNIGSAAFRDCINLTSVVIPESVATIGESVFDRSYKLKSLIIPDSVTTISTTYNGTFASVPLETVYCSNKQKTLCENALTSSSLDASSILKLYHKNAKGLYIVDGKFYQSLADAEAKNEYQFPKKRIYTIEEAERVSKKTGNTFKLRYK